MGRKLGEPTEQLNVQVPVGGREATDQLAAALNVSSRSELVWKLIQAAYKAQTNGHGFEAMLAALTDAQPLPDQLLKEAAVGRAAMAAMHDFEKKKE